jgi:hypothetical protein
MTAPTVTKIDPATEYERVTVIAKEFSPAAMEFHRREMGKKGYAMEGPIVRHTFLFLDGPGEPRPLLEGEPHFAVTFIRERSA